MAEMEYAMLGKPDKKPHAIFMMHGLWARGLMVMRGGSD